MKELARLARNLAYDLRYDRTKMPTRKQVVQMLEDTATLAERLYKLNKEADSYVAEINKLDNHLKTIVDAIDCEMVSTHLGVFNLGDDPVKAIKNLMDWSQGLGAFFANNPVPKVKSLCWRNTATGNCAWAAEHCDMSNEYWQRFPAGDIEGEGARQ